MSIQSLGRTVIMAMLIAASGCSSSDDRLVELSKQSLARQAEQNDALARQSELVAEASKQLVQADAQARQEIVAAQAELQQGLQAERSSLDRQHENLETERKALAAQRQRDPIVAAAVMQVGILLACLLPVAVCFYLLRAMKDAQPDGELCKLLIEELTASEPLLLPPPWPPDQAMRNELPFDDAT